MFSKFKYDDDIRAFVGIAQKSVKATTRENYDCHLRKLTSTYHEGKRRFLEPNLADFISWVVLMDKLDGAASARTVQAMRSAVREHMSSHGIYQDPTLNQLIDRGVAGYERMYPQGTVDYGPIDWQKMNKLIDFMLADDSVEDDTYWGVILMWTFGLRVGQVGKIRKCDIRRLARGRLWEYSCVRQKGRNAQQDQQVEYHEGAEQTIGYIEMLLERRKKMSPNESIVPGFSMAKANFVIKKAATLLGWTAGLQWSSHSLGHGSLTQARREGGLEKVYRRGGQLSGQTRELYSREEGQRKHGTPGRGRKAGATLRKKRAKTAMAK